MDIPLLSLYLPEERNPRRIRYLTIFLFNIIGFDQIRQYKILNSNLPQCIWYISRNPYNGAHHFAYSNCSFSLSCLFYITVLLPQYEQFSFQRKAELERKRGMFQWKRATRIAVDNNTLKISDSDSNNNNNNNNNKKDGIRTTFHTPSSVNSYFQGLPFGERWTDTKNHDFAEATNVVCYLSLVLLNPSIIIIINTMIN